MVDPRMLRVASDPVRLQTLTLLNERVAGESEVAAELGVSAGVARRHLEALLDEGMIEIAVDQESGEDNAEPRYRAVVRALLDDEEWATFSVEEQKRLTRWIIDMILSDVDEAIEEGTFTSRLNSHASRNVSQVDEQGWEELCRVHAEVLEEVFAIERASAERLADRGEKGFPALSAMICGELPSRRGGKPPQAGPAES